MFLTDSQLKEHIKKGQITIDPYNEKRAKAGKYNVHLGRWLLVPAATDTILDPTNPETNPQYTKIDLDKDPFILQPHQFVLGQTYEFIGIAANMGMFIDGSTTLARIGISIHQTATFINPGQDPHVITLEIFNASPWKIKLVNEMKIGKLIVFNYKKPNEICAKDYNHNRYNGQSQTTGAMFNNRESTIDSIV